MNLPVNYESDLEFSPLQVVGRDGNIEGAILKLKNMVQKQKVLIRFRAKQSYEKPSVKRRRKVAESQTRAFIANLRESRKASGKYRGKKKGSSDRQSSESQPIQDDNF